MILQQAHDERDKSVLNVHALTVAYKDKPVLWNVSAQIPSGVMCAVVGPNGAGKTTFIKSILGLIKPIAGTVAFFDGSYAQHYQKIAYVPQRNSVDWDFPVSVFDVVLMGRYGHIGWFKRPRKQDIDAAHIALHQVGLSAFANRHISQLSGGQQQRVFLARSLAQDAQLYIMDEPFAGVDIATEKTMIVLLKQLRSQGKTIIVVHHDLQTLQEYFDWILMLNKQVIACGPINQVLNKESIAIAYGKANMCIKYN